MKTGIEVYGPRGCCMSFYSPLLTGGHGKWKRYIRLSGERNFQGIHGAEPLWNANTNASATDAANGWTGVGLMNVKWSGWRQSKRFRQDKPKATVPRGSSISQGQKKNSLVEKIIWDSAGIDVYNNSIFISHMHL